MALYDGFFDASAESYAETGKYDRAYETSDFTDYFAKVIGSGVCVHNDPNSFLVRMESGQAVVSPGYLFINGYWLKNDADYPMDLPGDGNYAIVAYLNLGKRMIELEVRTVESAYIDALVLAIVSPTATNDTRYNTDLCGVIDTAGELSSKVEWAINYIDNEIEGKLAAMEQTIAAQEAKLDAKIAEVQAVADSIVPPPVGSIKFSASQNVDDTWLPCDGRFVNEKDYPELVAALGKLTPSGDKFQLLSDGEIGAQISNGALYDGRMWAYSYATGKLYGVDLDGGDTKEIALSSDSPYFGNFLPPSTTYPVCLSIVPHKNKSGAMLFLAQRLGADISGSGEYDWIKGMLMFQSEFTGSENSLEMSTPFTTISVRSGDKINGDGFLPYVVSATEDGEEKFLCTLGSRSTPGGSGSYPYLYVYYIKFSDSSAVVLSQDRQDSVGLASYQRSAFSGKSKGESAYIYTASSGSYRVGSIENNTFSTGYFSLKYSARSYNALNIVGQSKMISAFTLDEYPVIPLNGQTGANVVSHGINLPSAARVFTDAGAYLWGKDIYMIFVGTGIIFSRTLEEGSFGYLDTTGVMGTITQFGYLDYSEDEGALYLVGQDTTNSVKAAKIELNTLYDYANDGAWLPMIAADGVPAYIKAIEGGGSVIPDPADMKINITLNDRFNTFADLLFNGEVFSTSGSFTRQVSKSGTFTIRARLKTKPAYGNSVTISVNGTSVFTFYSGDTPGEIETVSFVSSDYLANGVSIVGTFA